MTNEQRDCFRAAYEYAALSNDQSTHNGAILVSRYDGSVVAHGYNHIPYRLATPERFERPLKYAYTMHAERHAVYEAWKKGEDGGGLDMYCCWAACSECATTLAQFGLRRLFRHFHDGHLARDDWNKSIEVGDSIMKDMGVEIVTLTGEVGKEVLFNGKVLSV